MELENLIKSVESKTFPINWPGNWIGNKWVAVEKNKNPSISVNPSRNTPLLTFYESKQATFDSIDCAEAEFSNIKNIPHEKRLELIQSIASALADYQKPIVRCMQLEAGKPAWEANADMEAALQHIESISKEGLQIYSKLIGPTSIGSLSGTYSTKSIGITSAYLAFSTPITSFVTYTTASIIAGCPLILYSSKSAALSSLLYAHILEGLNLPQGLISIINGSFDSFRHSIKDKRVAAVIYTGSREHCEEIRKESREIKERQLILQSGGKNSVIVDKSADLNIAARMILLGIVKSAGQLCTSTSRVFVHHSLSKDFKQKLKLAFESIIIGATDDFEDPKGPMMGPLYAEKSIERFLRYQTMAHREAQETVLWGKAASIPEASDGFFVSPGIHHVSKFDPTNAYQGNVIFSPDIAIYEYDVLEDAIRMINETDASFSVSFIGDEQVAQQKLSSFKALNIQVNLPTVEVESTLPLPGRFSTGLNRFHGPAMALYLIVPQVIQKNSELIEKLESWPKIV